MNIIFCVGEELESRKQNKQVKVVKHQLEEGLFHINNEDWNNIIIAYEPVWAIGTGRTATPAQAAAMHGVIRGCLQGHFGEAGANVPVIYGGSVKPENAGALFECDNIDGALVGGASLDANSFWQIASAASAGRA